jgi:hypothetical protein
MTVSVDKKCLNCGKNATKTYEVYCSQNCANLYMEYSSIKIPSPFLKSVFLHCPSKEDRKMQLINYAKRHKLKQELVIRKANELFYKSR